MWVPNIYLVDNGGKGEGVHKHKRIPYDGKPILYPHLSVEHGAHEEVEHTGQHPFTLNIV